MLEEILRISLTFLLAFPIGIERQLRRKSIGFGAFTLIAFGSATLTTIGLLFFPGNFLLILSGLISSIGFLGAGALFRTRTSAFGFTTASLLWTNAVFGITMGLGVFPYAGVLYVFMWVVLFTDRMIETSGRGGYSYTVVVSVRSLMSTQEVTKLLSSLPAKLIALTYNVMADETEVTFMITGALKSIGEPLYEIAKNPQIKTIRVT